MSHSGKAGEENHVEIKWGKVIHRENQVRYYESFTYDGVEYFLYDSVYLQAENELEPYIGKIVKIFDGPNCKQRVKIVWFFRPTEIQNHLGDIVPLEKEIFLASGNGVGLTQLNPLECILGKCNVVCTSKDRRNRPPSEEEIRKADNIFYRTFDVRDFTVSETLCSHIASIEVMHYLNRKEHPKVISVPSVTELNKTTISRFDKHGKAPISQHENRVKQRSSDLQHLGVSQLSSSVKLKLGDQASPSQQLETIVSPPLLLKKQQPNVHPPLATVKESSAKSVQKQQNIINEDAGNYSRSHLRSQEYRATIVNVNRNANKPHDEASPVLAKGKSTQADPKVMEAPHVKDSIVQDRRMSSKVTVSKPMFTDKPSAEVVAQEKSSLEPRKKPIDKSKWFADIPWEEKLVAAHQKGTLVLFQNLDPSYTSAEIEGIVWDAFKEKCTAKVLQKTTFSSPHNGQAFVIFSTSKLADKVVAQLDDGCLMLPHGRPLVAEKGVLRESGKPTRFVGHLTINRLAHKQREEMRNAVSTSHCSQPNTLEYEMALEWCLLQYRSDEWWKDLYKGHREELHKLKAKLKNRF